MKLFTVASDPTKAWRLLDSCRRFGTEPAVLGAGIDYPQNSIKIKLVRDALAGVAGPVVFVDGYDVEAVRDPREMVVPNYVLFAAERECYPFPELAAAYPPCDTPYRYLNSGCYCGPAPLLKRLLDSLDSAAAPSDQGLLTRVFLDHPGRILLDHTRRFFWCRHRAGADEPFDGFFVHWNGRSNPELGKG